MSVRTSRFNLARGSAVAPILRGPGGRAAIVTAAALWGTAGTAQAFAPADASPVSVGAARIVLGGLLLFAFAVRGGGLAALGGLGRGQWAALALAACCVAAYQLCFFAGVARTGVATGTVVTIGSSPVLIGLLSRLTGGQRLGPRWTISTAGAVCGCAALVYGGQAAGVEPVGVALSLASALGYATYAVCAARLIAAGTDHRAVIGVVFGGGGLLLVPVLAGTGTGWLLTGRGLAVALHLAVLTTAAGYLLYARGLRETPVATAGTLVLTEPAVATLLGVGLLGERMDGLAAGGLVLLAGSLVVLLVRRRRPGGAPGSRPGAAPRPPRCRGGARSGAGPRSWHGSRRGAG